MNTLACNHNWHCTFAFGTRAVNLCGMRSASKVVWPSLSESSRSSGRQSLQSRINCTSHLRVTRTRPVSISSRLATLRWCGVRYSVRRETRAVPPLAESRSPARLGRSCGRFIAAAPQRRSYSRDCGASKASRYYFVSGTSCRKSAPSALQRLWRTGPLVAVFFHGSA